MKFLLSPLLSVFILNAQASENAWKVIKAQKPAKGSTLPVELTQKIKEGFGSEIKEKNFLSFEVYLFDSAGLLGNGFKYLSPIGGGTINLAQVLPQGKAKFSVRINMSLENGEEVSPDEVYFVPSLSHIENGQELHCGKYYNVTSFFKGSLGSEKGFETYLSQGIYAPLLLGSFVFVKTDKKNQKVYLGNVNFIDERHSGKACLKAESIK